MNVILLALPTECTATVMRIVVTDMFKALLLEVKAHIDMIQNADMPRATLAGSKKKRTHMEKTEEDKMKTRGRAIPRLVTVYEDIHVILTQYDEYRRKRYHQEQPEEEDDELESENEEAQKERVAKETEKRRLQRGYMGVLQICRLFPKFLDTIKDKPSVIDDLWQGATSARSYDTNQVLKLVGEELNKMVDKANDSLRQRYREQMKEFHKQLRRFQAESPDSTGAASVEPIEPLEPIYHEKYAEKSRGDRGLQGNISGYLLCPVEFDWDDLAVRATLRKLEDPTYDFASSAHSRCFYPAEGFDPEDLDKGFLQSHLLLQVYRMLFTSPSSTKDRSDDLENLPPAPKKKKGTASHRANVAQRIQMASVVPRSIAYAAIHLHFALSDAPWWSATHDGYNYQDLWYFVIDFFEDPVDEDAEEHAKGLLKWWNDRIFTGTNSAANSRGTKMTSRKEDITQRQHHFHSTTRSSSPQIAAILAKVPDDYKPTQHLAIPSRDWD
ncbi:hypothetical protein F5890DRAFT_1473973 [Lentinula detonsa]|uniref:Uncharacterized protein n=1 Tax=Lentinula detonsa TaxID=2804962 RepID=A0AA38Q0G7_9AGAR|nr:hypothetical protein F5890DRAFT_1473973 [Lentinula detonsa]